MNENSEPLPDPLSALNQREAFLAKHSPDDHTKKWKNRVVQESSRAAVAEEQEGIEKPVALLQELDGKQTIDDAIENAKKTEGDEGDESKTNFVGLAGSLANSPETNDSTTPVKAGFGNPKSQPATFLLLFVVATVGIVGAVGAVRAAAAGRKYNVEQFGR